MLTRLLGAPACSDQRVIITFRVTFRVIFRVQGGTERGQYFARDIFRKLVCESRASGAGGRSCHSTRELRLALQTLREILLASVMFTYRTSCWVPMPVVWGPFPIPQIVSLSAPTPRRGAQQRPFCFGISHPVRPFGCVVPCCVSRSGRAGAPC